MPEKEIKTNKKFYILSVLVALLVIGITISASFAFFTNSKTTSTATVITSGSMSLELMDGAVVGTTNGMVPGDFVTKSFVVRNTGTLATAYDLYLSEVLNTFVDKSDLVYSINSTDGGFISSSELEVPSETGINSKIIDSYLINPGEAHSYVLTIKFLSKNENQDDNKGATFSGKLQINDYKEYKIASLDTGEKVNAAIKKLAKPEDEGISYWSSDQNVTSIVKANQIDNTKEKVDVSLSSDYPVYMWFDNGTIYYFTEANVISLNENSSNLFSQFNNMTSIDLSMFDTSNVTSMSSMFMSDRSLTSIDLSRFNTSKVTTFNSMFNGCSGLSSINIRNFNTSKVTNMFSTFARTGLINIDLRGLDFSSLTEAAWLFDGSSSLVSVNMSGLNMPKLESMRGMFNYCVELTTINFDGIMTPSLKNLSNMFYSAPKIKNIDLSSLDTSNVTDMSSMFNSATSLEIVDLSSFDTSSVTDMSNMFRDDQNLKTVYVGSFWNTDKVTSTWNRKGLFTNCTSIVGGAGTTYDSNNIDIEYATIDRVSNPGYFTYKRNKNFAEAVDGKVAILFYSDYYGSVPQTMHINIGETLGQLPEPTQIKNGVEFDGWYFDNQFTNKATSNYLLSSDEYGYWHDYIRLYAKYKGKDLNANGYNYWNDDYKYGDFAHTSAPKIVYSNYTYIVESGKSSTLIRTTYENGDPIKHDPCVYYNDALMCVDYGYWESIIGSTEESEENGIIVKNALESAISNTLGVNVECFSNDDYVSCSNSSESLYFSVDSWGPSSVSVGSYNCNANSRGANCYKY